MTTTRGDLATLSLWTGLEDEGGTNIGELSTVASYIERWDVEQGWSATAVVAVNDPSAAVIVKRNVLRSELIDGTVREFRIAEVSDERTGRGDTITIVAQDPRIDLAERVVLSTTGAGGVVYFDDGRADLAPADYVTDVVIPAATAAGISVAAGTISPTVLLSLDWQRASDLALVLQIVQGVRDRGLSCEFDYTRDPGNGYEINLVDEIGSGLTVPELHVGRHLGAWKRRKSASEQASRVIPFGSPDATGYPATIARAGWRVTAITTNTLTLEDPAGGTGPVQFTGQADPPEGPWHIVAPVTGTAWEVLSSVRVSATASDLELADASDFAVDDIVEIRADAAGTLISSLVHPTFILAPPTGFGEKVVPLERGALMGERNLAPNAWMRAYTGGPSGPADGYTAGQIWAVPTITQETGPLIRFGPNAMRILSNPGGTVFDVFSPWTPVFPVAGAEMFSFSWALYFFIPPTLTYNIADLSLIIQTTPAAVPFPPPWKLQVRVPVAQIPVNTPFDLSIVGVNLSGATSVRMGVARGGVVNGQLDFLWDAAQITQTPAQADAYFEFSRANPLWQAGNEYLRDFGDPPADFDGNLLDYERLEPGAWAELTIAPGVSTRLIDVGRGIDWTVRAVQIEWNRLTRGDTRIRWSARPKSLIAAVGGGSKGKEIGPYQPGVPGTPQLPPGTPAPPPPVLPDMTVLFPFYSRGDTDVTLTPFPSAETQRTTRTEDWCYLGGYNWVRLEANVVTGLTGARFVAKYKTSNGGTWEYLDGIAGPELLLDTAGTVKGSDVFLATGAQADVIVGLFEVDGDDASDVVVGNVFLHAHTGVSLPGSSDGGCPIPGSPVASDDLSGYADYADFLATQTYFGGDLDSDSFDTGSTFNDSPAVVLHYEEPAISVGGFIPQDGAAVDGDVFEFMMVFELPTGIDSPSLAPETPDDPDARKGFVVFEMGTLAGLYIRGGILVLDVWTFCTDVPPNEWRSHSIDFSTAISTYTGRPLMLQAYVSIGTDFTFKGTDYRPVTWAMAITDACSGNVLSPSLTNFEVLSPPSFAPLALTGRWETGDAPTPGFDVKLWQVASY